MEMLVGVSGWDHESGDDVVGFWEQRCAVCHPYAVPVDEVGNVSDMRIGPWLEVGCL